MTLASDVVGLLGALDELYRRSVTDPGALSDGDLVAEGERALAAHQLAARADKRVQRWVRRGARLSVKLRRHWEERLRGGRPVPEDWRSRVDEALGGRGWQPLLDLARWGLEADPDPELFEEVQERFRWVYLHPWLEGVTYEEYLDTLPGRPE